jgi:hypothetical protein
MALLPVLIGLFVQGHGCLCGTDLHAAERPGMAGSGSVAEAKSCCATCRPGLEPAVPLEPGSRNTCCEGRSEVWYGMPGASEATASTRSATALRAATVIPRPLSIPAATMRATLTRPVRPPGSPPVYLRNEVLLI